MSKKTAKELRILPLGEPPAHHILGGEREGGRTASGGAARRSRRWQPARLQVRVSATNRLEELPFPKKIPYLH
jgi:hypothetical protein